MSWLVNGALPVPPPASHIKRPFFLPAEVQTFYSSSARLGAPAYDTKPTPPSAKGRRGKLHYIFSRSDFNSIWRFDRAHHQDMTCYCAECFHAVESPDWGIYVVLVSKALEGRTIIVAKWIKVGMIGCLLLRILRRIANRWKHVQSGQWWQCFDEYWDEQKGRWRSVILEHH